MFLLQYGQVVGTEYLLGVVAGEGGAHSRDGVLPAGTGSAVAGGVFQALLMTLDGRLMVSHGIPPIFWPAMQV